MMFWYGHSVGAWGWVAMSFSMVLFWALVIGVGVMLFRALRSTPDLPGPLPGSHPGPKPEQLLAERFARGEIDEEEYRQRLAVLHGSPPLTKHG